MNTELFRNWKDYFQFVYFSGGLAVGWISGHLSLRKIRSALEKAENIIRSPKSNMDQKYHAACDAIDESCFYLGVVFEKYNRKQRTAPGWKEAKTKEENIEEVKKN